MTSLSDKLNNVAEFLRTVEQSSPIVGHVKFFDAWAEDVKELAEDSEIFDTTLDSVLAVRKLSHSLASSSASSTSLEDDSWKWLLTVAQVEQRTQEWYEETKNILTASEVATVFKTGRTRGSLVVSKTTPVQIISSQKGAVERRNTSPFDWGIRYEPVVKEYLESSLCASIQDLGRIRHRTVEKIAASPDGLITKCEKDASLVGRLVEIKCPSSRIINDKIPFEYWCQMQLQMEVCDRPACEFVEAKFTEGELDESAIASGIIRLESNVHTNFNRYVYSQKEEDDWALVETYHWNLVQLRRVTVLRDPTWFEESKKDFAKFWEDVEGARNGTWHIPEAKARKIKEKAESICEIVD